MQNGDLQATGIIRRKRAKILVGKRLKSREVFLDAPAISSLTGRMFLMVFYPHTWPTFSIVNFQHASKDKIAVTIARFKQTCKKILPVTISSCNAKQRPPTREQAPDLGHTLPSRGDVFAILQSDRSGLKRSCTARVSSQQRVLHRNPGRPLHAGKLSFQNLPKAPGTDSAWIRTSRAYSNCRTV